MVPPAQPPPLPPQAEEDDSLMIKAEALYEYDAAEEDEISLKVGDQVWIYFKHVSGWWTGECNGKYGIFPGEYVKEIEDLTHKKPTSTSTGASPHGSELAKSQPEQATKNPENLNTTAASAPAKAVSSLKDTGRSGSFLFANSKPESISEPRPNSSVEETNSRPENPNTTNEVSPRDKTSRIPNENQSVPETQTAQNASSPEETNNSPENHANTTNEASSRDNTPRGAEETEPQDSKNGSVRKKPLRASSSIVKLDEIILGGITATETTLDLENFVRDHNSDILKKRNTLLEQENQQLSERNRELEQKAQTATQLAEKLREKINKHEQLGQTHKQLLQEYEEQIQQMTEKLSEAQQAKSQLSSELQGLRNQLSSATENNFNLKTQLHTQEEEMGKHLSSLQDLKNQNHGLEVQLNMKLTTENLQSETEKDQKLKELERKIKIEQNSSEGLSQSILQELELQGQNLMQETETVFKLIEKMVHTEEETHDETDQLKHEIQELTVKLQTQMLESEKQSKQQLQTMEEEFLRRETELKKKIGELQRAKSDLEIHEKKLNDRERHLQEIAQKQRGNQQQSATSQSAVEPQRKNSIKTTLLLKPHVPASPKPELNSFPRKLILNQEPELRPEKGTFSFHLKRTGINLRADMPPQWQTPRDQKTPRDNSSDSKQMN